MQVHATPPQAAAAISQFVKAYVSRMNLSDKSIPKKTLKDIVQGSNSNQLSPSQSLKGLF